MSDAGLPPTYPTPRAGAVPDLGATGPHLPQSSDDELPERLGRYRITAKLGEGGFGVVYKGYDEELRRDVAIKVPHREQVRRPRDAELYLAEARVVAGLDHPHIVPVFDLGRTEDGSCFVVSKYAAGCALAEKIAAARLSWVEAVPLTATVAEALHYAHKRGVVHRDVKPSNILLDQAGQPHLADFGLALREEEFGRDAGVCGTPAYMSPEQASGEGHRVDGRSDIFSLGVVFYELLTGVRPFRGDLSNLFRSIVHDEPRPPRQVNNDIPTELERICLKALAKRPSGRYNTALDLAQDLRHFLNSTRDEEDSVVRSSLGAASRAVPETAPASRAGPTATPSLDQRPWKVVPKGLRSFDVADAGFFLELLPGPRDRDGLPESIRFWKTRIEETDPDNTFSVGLIYGPSGCGKSSLVRAGLLPRLGEEVIAVYVEATANETESRLLHGLRKRCPQLPGAWGLREMLTGLRRGEVLPKGKKVLLVLDQFEQWLHADRTDSDTQLVQALRQCDGRRAQCVVLVRDDFWMAATRFVHDLELPLVEGQNSAAVDLFDPRHAAKVLTLFGRAFGALPEGPGDLSAEQAQFVAQAVEGLAQGGKVISVRLALFADMVKGRPWTPATLRTVGGAAGVGVSFLEETFSTASAPPEHRYHQRAARAVLQALLPELGSDIKGRMLPLQELQRRAGYESRPAEWERLLRILDNELRLVTPTDPEGVAGGGWRVASEGVAVAASDTWSLAADSPATRHPPPATRYYQLTHDYLVPALRDWLTRKQKETRRGRAELLLADRASIWDARRENRQLPSLAQWLRIRVLTRRTDWTPPQRAMMRRAAGCHALRALALATGLLLIGLASWDTFGRSKAHALCDRLLVATTAEVPGIVGEIAPYRQWAGPLLQEAYARARDENDSRKQLHATLALLPVDPGQADYLFGRLLDAAPGEMTVLIEALRPYAAGRLDSLWDAAERPPGSKESQRLRAACALAAYDKDNPRWEKVASPVVAQFVAENSLYRVHWIEGFRPVRDKLFAPLARLFRNRAGGHSVERAAATEILDEYVENPDAFADLLLDADARQFAALFPKLAAHGEAALRPLEAELDKTPPHNWNDKPLDPSWRKPASDLVGQVEAAEGLVAERFALCQGLPLGEFGKVAEGLRPCGYRPVRVRPYWHNGRVLVAAVWTRDGRAWRLDLDMRLTEGVAGAESSKPRSASPGLRKASAPATPACLFPARRQEGFQPTDVAGYLDAGRECYAAVWAKAKPGEVSWYVGVPEADHRVRGWQPLREKKLYPATLQTFRAADGTVRFSSIFRDSPRGLSLWNTDEGTFADRVLSEGLPLDVALTYSFLPHQELLAGLAGSPWPAFAIHIENARRPYPERHYAGVFSATASTAFDGEFVAGLPPGQQRQRWEALARAGYRPAALTVAAVPPGGTLVSTSVWHRPVIAEEAKEALAKRQANAAAALLRLGKAERLWPLLRHRPDPRLRTYLIHRLSPLGADPQAIVRHWQAPGVEVSVRRALLLCLGGFDERQLPAAEREALVPALLRAYRDDPDPGVHAAAEWLLRKWKQQAKVAEIDQALATGQPEGNRRWYVNHQRQTFVLLGPGHFIMGSLRTEPWGSDDPGQKREMPHRRRIERRFALAAKEVTVVQFLRFNRSHYWAKLSSPSGEHPVNAVSWYGAAAYCNWLSEREGIPRQEWCYVPHPRNGYAAGMRPAPDFLRKTGYRLPTEAEWEYACRAGASTAYPWGADDEGVMREYECFSGNSQDRSMFPGGRLKPNDFGLFDMLGNASEWVQDPGILYPGARGETNRGEIIRDFVHMNYVEDRVTRVQRGGNFVAKPLHLRAASRNFLPPINRNYVVGFRPARTLP